MACCWPVKQLLDSMRVSQSLIHLFSPPDAQSASRILEIAAVGPCVGLSRVVVPRYSGLGASSPHTSVCFSVPLDHSSGKQRPQLVNEA